MSGSANNGIGRSRPSTGMKQAAKLACALIHDPEMIIADEPTNGLDLASRNSCSRPSIRW